MTNACLIIRTLQSAGVQRLFGLIKVKQQQRGYAPDGVRIGEID